MKILPFVTFCQDKSVGPKYPVISKSVTMPTNLFSVFESIFLRTSLPVGQCQLKDPKMNTVQDMLCEDSGCSGMTTGNADYRTGHARVCKVFLHQPFEVSTPSMVFTLIGKSANASEKINTIK